MKKFPDNDERNFWEKANGQKKKVVEGGLGEPSGESRKLLLEEDRGFTEPLKETSRRGWQERYFWGISNKMSGRNR